jgi:hypothetical protein
VKVAGMSVPRVDRATAHRLLPDARFARPRLAYRDVSGAANRVSLIAAVLPPGTLTTHTIFCLRTPLAPPALHLLSAYFNSYVLNAFVRMLMGNHLTTALVERLPAPAPGQCAGEGRLSRLSARLAQRPNPRTEALLQAQVARAYELDRSEFIRLLDGFPLVPASDRERAARAFSRE